MQSFVYVLVVTANVVLRRAAALVDLGLGYSNYWWGSQYWADFVIANWVPPQRHYSPWLISATVLRGWRAHVVVLPTAAPCYCLGA